jgi:porin
MSFDVAIEARGPISTDLPPLQGGIAAGNIVPTAATWGDFDLGFTQFYVRQSLMGNRFQYAIGKLFAPNFVNAYPFFDDNRQFLNQNFSTSPTIASALRGFGAVALVFPTNSGLYVQGGIYTANSEDTGFTVGNFFSENEYFTSAEIGWSGLARSGVPIHARGPMDRNNVHLTYWHKDEQANAASVFRPEMEGLAFNANFMAGENLMWFVRGGQSRGWVTEKALSAGFGYRPENASDDLFGLGIAWTEPANDALRDQRTVETFYRFQVTPNFAITPDLQLVMNPTLNPTVDTQVIMSLRARVTF